MATVGRRSRQHTYERISVAEPEPARRSWRMVIIPVALATLLWLLPGIVAHTPLLSWAVRTFSKLEATVAIRSASLGWFSPITVSGVEIRDAQNRPVLQLSEMKTEKSLLGILSNLSTVGSLKLDKPKLTLLLRKDGSNLEDVMIQWLKAEGKSGRTAIALEIVDGSVSVVDDETRQTWEIEKLQLALNTTQDSSLPTKLNVTATMPGAQHPGSLSMKFHFQPREAPSKDPSPELSLDNSDGELIVETEAIPLAMFERLAGRFVPELRLSGRLVSKVDLQWSGPNKVGLAAELTTNELTLGGTWFGKDLCRLGQARVTCKAARQDQRVELQQSTVESDVGNLTATATMDLGDKGLADLSGAVWRQTCEVRGQLDLARLARLIPGTLHVRQGMEITSGQIQMAVRSEKSAWQAQVETSNLTAVDQGRQLTWERPVRVAMAAHQVPDGFVVDGLQCESDFLKVNAAGTPDKLAASLTFNLKLLTDHLGQFLDLSGFRLAGDGWGNFHWTRTPDLNFEADGEFQLHNFQLATAQSPPWIEENLVVALAAKGRTNLGADTRVDMATLQIRSGNDQLDARLVQPVADLRTALPIDVQMQGQLDRWPARLATFVAAQDWRLGGTYQASAQFLASKDTIAVQQAKLTASQLILGSPSLNLTEPAVELTASGRWERQSQRLRIDAANLTSGTVSMQAKELAISMPEKGPMEMTGAVSYRADMERMRPWFAVAGKPPTWQMSGQLSGTAQFQQSAGQIQGRTEADIARLVVANASGPQFQEPQIHLIARGSYQSKDGIVRLDQVELTSAAVSAKATVQTAQASNPNENQLTGELSYDWERLSGLLRPYLGPDVRIAGRGTSPVSYRGPLWPLDGQGAAALRWQGAQVYGFQVGQGELKTQLSGGVLQAEPLQLACNGGRLLFAPRIRLNPEPMELTMAAGPLAQQVQIDPGMCRAALMYVAPVLAEVTMAAGKFSIDLEGCRIPLADPAKGEFAGRLTVHSVEVGPGPLVQELSLLLAAQPTLARLKRESVIPFRMAAGRIYHEGLEIEFPELTVRTSGSVGLDQSLAVMTEMSVPPKWLAGTSLGDVLKNQVVRIPIGGTLTRPQIDRQEITKMSRQVLANTTRGTIQTEVNKQLNRLLGPPR